jgi:hypothetical protein
MSKVLTSFGLSQSSLEIPLVHITGVRADSEVACGWWHGVRMPGTSVPGVITAGTFYQDGKRVFRDVHHPEKTIVIDLHDERFNELVVGWLILRQQLSARDGQPVYVLRRENLARGSLQNALRMSLGETGGERSPRIEAANDPF